MMKTYFDIYIYIYIYAIYTMHNSHITCKQYVTDSSLI